MNITKIRKENGDTLYIGYRKDIKSLLKKLKKRGVAEYKYRRFPKFNNQREVYGLLVKGNEMVVVNSERIVKELLDVLRESKEHD